MIENCYIAWTGLGRVFITPMKTKPKFQWTLLSLCTQETARRHGTIDKKSVCCGHSSTFSVASATEKRLESNFRPSVGFVAMREVIIGKTVKIWQNPAWHTASRIGSKDTHIFQVIKCSHRLIEVEIREQLDVCLSMLRLFQLSVSVVKYHPLLASWRNALCFPMVLFGSWPQAVFQPRRDGSYISLFQERIIQRPNKS